MLKKWALFSGMLFAVVGIGCGTDEEPKKAPALAENPGDIATWRSSEATQRETGIARWGFEHGDSAEGAVRGYANAESIVDPSIEIRYRLTDKALVLESKNRGAIQFDISDPGNVVLISDTLTEDANLLANVVSSAARDLEASEAAEASAASEEAEPSLVKTSGLRPLGNVVIPPDSLIQQQCTLIKRSCVKKLLSAASDAAVSSAECQLLEKKRDALEKCAKACAKLTSEADAQEKACSKSIETAHQRADASPECTTMKVTAKECGAKEPALNSK